MPFLYFYVLVGSLLLSLCAIDPDSRFCFLSKCSTSALLCFALLGSAKKDRLTEEEAAAAAEQNSPVRKGGRETGSRKEKLLKDDSQSLVKQIISNTQKKIIRFLYYWLNLRLAITRPVFDT